MDRYLLRYAGIKVLRIMTSVLRMAKVKDNRILFQVYSGKRICDSPKYLADYIVENAPDKYEIVWASNDVEINKKRYPNYKVIKYGGLQYLYYYATSAMYITNMGPFKIFKKRKKQRIINTWHGGGAYKKDGIDRPSMSKYAKAINSEYGQNDVDVFLSSCDAFTKYTLKGAFRYDGEILSCGLPRNDILVNWKTHSAGLKTKIYNRYNIKLECRTVLYAPTWREYSFEKFEQLDVERLLCNLADKFGGEWVFLFRGHNLSDITVTEKSNIIDVGDYDEMQELLCSTEILISDYSSCLWDYSLTGKPAFLYVPDLNLYDEEYSFYYPIEKWGFPYAISNEKMAECILNFDNALYESNLKKCLNDMGVCETGNARKIVFDRIEQFFGGRDGG